MLSFDEKGNLTPYKSNSVVLEDVELLFVKGIPDNLHRQRLFDNYLLYLDALKPLMELPFIQWVNGSFATKKRRPGDIDLVNFIDYQVVERNSATLQSLSREVAFEKYQIDANIVKVYPQGHPKEHFTISDRLYWEHQFGYTSKNRNGKRFQKGFLQLNF